MNHLAHFLLAAPQSGLIVGSLLGDHVKGRLTGAYPEQVDLGIRLHRAIDAWTDQNPVVRRSHRRFDKPFRRFAPLMTDIIFDYFLANRWNDFHREPLIDFHENIFAVIDEHDSLLPAKARLWSQRMQQSRAFLSYREPEFIQRSFVHLSTRLSRTNPLAEGLAQFEMQRRELEDDFLIFFPMLVEFVTDWKQHRLNGWRATS